MGKVPAQPEGEGQGGRSGEAAHEMQLKACSEEAIPGSRQRVLWGMNGSPLTGE